MFFEERYLSLQWLKLTFVMMVTLKQIDAFQLQPKSSDLNRRDAIELMTKVANAPLALAPTLLPLSPANANDNEVIDDFKSNNKPSDPFLVYKVNPDASAALSPSIEAMDVSIFLLY